MSRADEVGTPIECHRCGYPWRTMSKRPYVPCPFCHTTVRNRAVALPRRR